MKRFLTTLALFLQGFPRLLANSYTDLWPFLQNFKPVAFTGALVDISDKPTLAEINNTMCAALGVTGKTAWTEPASDTSSVNALKTLYPPLNALAAGAFTGSYADVLGRPNLTATARALQASRSSAYVFETPTVQAMTVGDIETLKQLYPFMRKFSKVAFTGRYFDLTGPFDLLSSFDVCQAETTTTTQSTTASPPPTTSGAETVSKGKNTDEG
jgi:hypothetical protein